VIALAAHLFHGADRLEGVRGDFGNLAVADIEDSEAAAARHEVSPTFQSGSSLTNAAGSPPPRFRASTESGRSARRSSPRRAQASTVTSAAELEKVELAHRARLSKQTLTTMARALERDGRSGAGSACAARGDQPCGLVIAKVWIAFARLRLEGRRDGLREETRNLRHIPDASRAFPARALRTM
jgi:hypothetical protein